MIAKSALSETVIWTIRGSKDIREGLMNILGISRTTLFKYLRENDSALTQEDVVRFLTEKTKQSRNDILMTIEPRAV